MNEKPESEEFEDEDEDVVEDGEGLDIDGLMATFDKRKRGAVKPEEPAWRRLERYREERNTARQLDDFEDYEIGDPSDRSSAKPRKGKRI